MLVVVDTEESFGRLDASGDIPAGVPIDEGTRKSSRSI